MVSDLWRLREAIDRGTIKGLYYGDVQRDLVDALGRLICMEDAVEDLLIEDMNATQSLQHLHGRVDALERGMKDIDGALDDAISKFDGMAMSGEIHEAQEELIERIQKTINCRKD